MMPVDVEIERLAWRLLELRGSRRVSYYETIGLRISALDDVMPTNYHDSFICVEGGQMPGGSWLIVDNANRSPESLPWVLRRESGRATEYDRERGPETLEWLRKLLPLESLVI